MTDLENSLVASETISVTRVRSLILRKNIVNVFRFGVCIPVALYVTGFVAWMCTLNYVSFSIKM